MIFGEPVIIIVNVYLEMYHSICCLPVFALRELLYMVTWSLKHFEQLLKW